MVSRHLKKLRPIAPSLPLISALLFQFILIYSFGIGDDLDSYYLASGLIGFFLVVIAGLTSYWAFPNIKLHNNKQYFDCILSLGIMVNIPLVLVGVLLFYFTDSVLPLAFVFLITPSVILSLYMYDLYLEGDYVLGSLINTVPNIIVSFIIIKFPDLSLFYVVLSMVLVHYVLALSVIFKTEIRFSIRSLGLLKSSNSLDLIKSSIVSKSLSPIDRATLASGDEGLVSVYSLFERIISVVVTVVTRYHELLLLTFTTTFKMTYLRFIPGVMISTIAYFCIIVIFKNYIFGVDWFPLSLKNIELFLTVLLYAAPIIAVFLWANSLVIAELYSKGEHGYILKINVLVLLLSLIARLVVIWTGSYLLLPFIVTVALMMNLFFFYRHLRSLNEISV